MWLLSTSDPSQQKYRQLQHTQNYPWTWVNLASWKLLTPKNHYLTIECSRLAIYWGIRTTCQLMYNICLCMEENGLPIWMSICIQPLDLEIDQLSYQWMKEKWCKEQLHLARGDLDLRRQLFSPVFLHHSPRYLTPQSRLYLHHGLVFLHTIIIVEKRSICVATCKRHRRRNPSEIVLTVQVFEKSKLVVDKFYQHHCESENLGRS